jgi:PAS domain S-box-containing protein
MDDARKTKSALIGELRKVRADMKKLKGRIPKGTSIRTPARKSSRAPGTSNPSLLLGERYRDLFENSGTGIIVIDENGTYLLANKTAAAAFGKSPEDVIGKSMFDLLPRDAAERYLAFNRQFLEIGGEREYEDTFQLPSGERSFLIVDHCLTDEHGKHFAVQSSSIDITGRKLAEEALRVSDERFATAFRASPVSIAIARLEDNRLVEVNTAWLAMTGFGRDEVIGRTASELNILVDPRDRVDALQRFRDEEKTTEIEFQLRRKSGEIADVLMSAELIEFGGERCLLSLGQDISERKRAESGLRQVLEWQQAIFEGSRDAIFISDQESRFVAVNNAACKLTGYSRDELLRMRIPDIHEVSDLTAYNTYNQRIFDGEEILSEAKILRSDGTKRDAEFNNRRMVIAGKTYMHTTARDITERRLVATALAETESQLAAVLESTNDFVWSVDAKDFSALTFNRALKEFYQKERGIEFRKGLMLDELFQGDWLSKWQQFYQRALQEGPFSVVYETTTRDRTFELKFGLLKRDNTVFGISVFGRDISQRKRAEDALRKEQALLSTIIEAIPDEICLKDTESRYVLANKASVMALGAKSLEEMIGKTDLDYVRPEMALRHLAEEKAVLESGEPAISRERTRLDPKTGEITKCDLSTKVPVKDRSGIATGLLVINRDITDRKHAEVALHESELRFRAFIEQAPLAIIVTREGICLYANDKAAQMYGLQSVEEFKGLPAVELFAPQVREESKDRTRRRSLGLPVPEEFESVALRVDGSQFPVLVAVSNIQLPEGNANISFITDIAERKRAEEHLLTTQEQLRLLAGHLQSVREEERKHLSQEFHDQLGQTLTALKMDLALVQRELADKTKELSRVSLAESLHSMYSLIDGGIQMIREIMSELHPELLDQLGLVAALEWEAERFQKRSGLKCRFTSELGEFQFDPKRSIALFRIFQEALTNVARHAQATTVDVSMRRENDDVLLEIRDNGTGIEPNAEQKTGSFGLIGMRERAILLGGRLEITSIKGRGTTVLVRMP